MPWIILDRDGVINYDSTNFIRSLDDWQPIPGSIGAIARLCQAGWQVTVATNQSGIARGLISPGELDAIHAFMFNTVSSAGGHIQALTYCPHSPSEGCKCRKPQPGMYLSLAERLNKQLSGVPVVGDSARDLEAAIEVGARPILVRTGKGEETLQSSIGSSVEVYANLSEVVDCLI